MKKYSKKPFKLVLSVFYCIQFIVVKQIRNSTNKPKTAGKKHQN